MHAQQRHQLRHVVAEELPACVDPLTQPVEDGFDAPADAVARLQHKDGMTAALQLERRGQAAEACSNDNDVMQCRHLFSPVHEEKKALNTPL